MVKNKGQAQSLEALQMEDLLVMTGRYQCWQIDFYKINMKWSS